MRGGRATSVHAAMAAVGFLCLVMIQGCPPSTTGDGSQVQNVTPSEAQALIQQHQGDSTFRILDVRTPAEYAAGHIENAVNVDYLSLSFASDVSTLDKSNTYFVYCGTEHRSPLAVAVMQQQGFTNLYNLTGGLTRWQSEGFPVVQ
jgi:rhodanese-related sulfurtransferase